MIAEMSGQELQDWTAFFELREEDRRDMELDMKGKSNLRKHMMGR